MRIEITGIERAFEGLAFGEVGPYQKITGRAFGEVDPFHPLNAGIVNLDKAPRNSAGRVEYWTDFCLLRPADMDQGNRRLLYEVVNRGNKLALATFNDGPRENNPCSASDAGNGFLMRKGYSVLWSGWQGDAPQENNCMRAVFPVATAEGAPIVALNRDEFIFDEIGDKAIVTLSYPASTMDQRQATLTVRRHNRDKRIAIRAEAWRYVSPAAIEITRSSGYDAGAIYEFIYPARDPIVMGLGFAAIRDMVAFLHHDHCDAASNSNPLNHGSSGPAVDHVIAFGTSQSGRILRDFLWQNFNHDLTGRRVFDGVFINVAGSRKSFTNFAFAQPGRVTAQHESNVYPGDQFPFTYATRFDSVSGNTDGLLARCRASGTCPKIIHTDTSTEFYQGRGALIVTDGRGHDIELPEEARVYHYASIQHAGPISNPVPSCQFPRNPVKDSPLQRALLVALDEWITSDKAPPDSCYSSVQAGTLVSPEENRRLFPEIPGVKYPKSLNELAQVNYDTQPPEAIPGRSYVLLVPAVDADGNEEGGIRVPDVAVPLATYTGWNPRRAGFAQGELAGPAGSYLPFARTAKERRQTGDSRLSLEERYPSHEQYVESVKRAAIDLQKRRLLLAEDVERYIKLAETLEIGKPG